MTTTCRLFQTRSIWRKKQRWRAQSALVQALHEPAGQVRSKTTSRYIKVKDSQAGATWMIWVAVSRPPNVFGVLGAGLLLMVESKSQRLFSWSFYEFLVFFMILDRLLWRELELGSFTPVPVDYFCRIDTYSFSWFNICMTHWATGLVLEETRTADFPFNQSSEWSQGKV